MSIMDMFKGITGAPAAPAPTNQPTPPGNIPANAASTGTTPPGTAANGVIPPVGETKPEPAPLDAFSDLWKTAPIDPNAPAPDTVFGNVDPKKFMEAAGKVDFSKAIKPEMLAAIQAGGEDGVKAFAAAMNSVAQNVYAQASFASTKITEQALAKARESFESNIPNLIKQQTAAEALRNENPVFSHPAAAPILGAIQSQLAVKFPQASATELTAMAKTYLENFATGISAPATAAAAKKVQEAKGANETDWSTFLG